MSDLILEVTKRKTSGTGDARRMRHAQKLPGIIYGAGEESEAITLDVKPILKLMREQHAILNIKVDGKKEQVVLKEIQVHPVSGAPIHIDFMRIAAGHEIKVTVPINLTGEAAGAKVGGRLSIHKNEVEISVLPRFMPESIDLDVSAMEIGDSMHIKDISAENFTILDDLNNLICQIVAEREEEPEEEAEETEETAGEPEVITAKSDDEE